MLKVALLPLMAIIALAAALLLPDGPLLGGQGPGDGPSPSSADPDTALLPENEGSPAPSDLLDIIQVTPGTSTDHYYYPELVSLDDGSLLMLSNRCCWSFSSQVSSDGGLTWSDPVEVLEEAFFPDAIQDSQGVIWLVYARWNGPSVDTFLRTSADGGDTWSEERPVAADPDLYEDYPSIARTPTGRLVAAYSSGGAVYSRVSDDGGDTWSEAAILDDQSAYYPDLAVAPDGSLWAVYKECCWRVYYRASSDDGETWSERQLLAEDGVLPSVDFSGPEVLVSYERYDCSFFTCTYDIWYVRGTPEDIGEATPVRFTAYGGRDLYASVAAMPGGNFGIAWASARRLSDGVFGTRQSVWLGVPGVYEDLSPPAGVNRYEHTPPPNPDPNDEVFVLAHVLDDEPGFSSSVVWTMDGVEQDPVPMADDGASGDLGPGDNVYGASLGVLPEGTSVSYIVRTEDVDGNVLETFQSSFQVVPQWVAQEPLLLVVDARYEWERDQAAPFYREALDTLGIAYDFWDASLRGTPDPDDLDQHPGGTVVWSAPDSDALVIYDLNVEAATSALASHLDAGGSLLMSGQYLFDLSYYAPAFYNEYLHVTQWDACVGVRDLEGTEGDFIGGGLMFAIEGGSGSNNQWCPHAATTRAPAETIFSYVDLAPAGVAATPDLPLLAPRNPSEALGRTRSQVLAEFPGYALPAQVTESGWWKGDREGEVAFRTRAMEVAGEVAGQLRAQACDGHGIALVAHGGFAEALLKALFGQAPADPPTYRHHNTGVSRVSFGAQGTQVDLVYLNR